MDNKKMEMKKTIEKNMKCRIDLIDENDKFEFKCTACGKCCSNDTVDMVLLNPMDLYRLSKGTKKDIPTILNEYTDIYIGKNSNFPVVRIKAILDMGKSFMYGMEYRVCPFLKDNKCSVHDHKPSICKLYPLGRFSSRTIDKNEKSMAYFLLKDNCGGKGEYHNLDNWVKNRHEDERLLSEMSDFFNELHKVMDLKKVSEIAEKDETVSRILDRIHQFLIGTYYTSYDINKPFWEQYQENKAEILAKLKMMQMGLDVYLRNL